MFLIDSSAWVEYLRPRGSRAVKERVREAIEKEEAAACSVVVVEVLRGAKTEKEFEELGGALMALPQLEIDGPVAARAARWGFALERKGRTVSTTDLLIASAAYKKASLLHLDGDFEVIASHFDLKQERLQH